MPPPDGLGLNYQCYQLRRLFSPVRWVCGHMGAEPDGHCSPPIKYTAIPGVVLLMTSPKLQFPQPHHTETPSELAHAPVLWALSITNRTSSQGECCGHLPAAKCTLTLRLPSGSIRRHAKHTLARQRGQATRFRVPSRFTADPHFRQRIARGCRTPAPPRPTRPRACPRCPPWPPRCAATWWFQATMSVSSHSEHDPGRAASCNKRTGRAW